jgi:hypothetical protein
MVPFFLVKFVAHMIPIEGFEKLACQFRRPCVSRYDPGEKGGKERKRLQSLT